MNVQQTTFGLLQYGDIFYFPTMDAQATLLVRTEYWTQHIDTAAIVFKVVKL
jgi:hypothetical protein